MSNLALYLVCAWFLAICLRALLLRNRAQTHFYRLYLWQLLPAFVLVPFGIYMGVSRLPDHELVFHGYRVALDKDSRQIYLGSDSEDQLRFHHRVKDEEHIEKSLLELNFAGGSRQVQIRQTTFDTPNVVSVNGRPIGAKKLEVGRTHRISFAAFNYSDADQDVLEVQIPHLKSLGSWALAKPEFSFRGQRFRDGFSHRLGWFLAPILPAVATQIGSMKHLAWDRRIFHPALDQTDGSILKQAAIARFADGYWLIANDAQIRLDGEPFPTGVTVNGSTILTLESRQLGQDRWSGSFKLIPPAANAGEVYLERLPGGKVHLPLPPPEVADRLCLTRNPSSYSGTFDIADDQFPMGGMILSREGNRFLFRGKALAIGQPHACGNSVFSIESARSRNPLVLAGFSLLFLATALFVPGTLLRRVPLLGPLIAIGVFLHALRQVLGFRAWQGPPHQLNVFLDSAAAPYLFVLAVVVVVSRYPFFDFLKGLFFKGWNFVFPHRRKTLPLTRDDEMGKSFFRIVVYGLILHVVFSDFLGNDFLMVILFFLVVSLVLTAIGRWELNMNAHRELAQGVSRYLPLLSLGVLMVLAMISAPLLGGREVLPFLPGRLRPDIFIQIGLLLIVAYQAGLWERERRIRVANLVSILAIYAFIFLLPLFQGVLARDMGFFVMVAVPVLSILLVSSWGLDARLKLLFLTTVILLACLPTAFRMHPIPLEKTAAQRVAFWLDKPRLRSEYFFQYQAQVPILWTSDQGAFGGGYFRGDWYPALKSTAVNDNVAAVFIQGELGGLGTFLVMSLFSLLALVGVLYLRDNQERAGGFRVWIIFGLAITFLWTAAAMFLQNLGYLPLTGKNLPFLGLDSKNDVIRYGILLGLMARYMRHFEE